MIFRNCLNLIKIEVHGGTLNSVNEWSLDIPLFLEEVTFCEINARFVSFLVSFKLENPSASNSAENYDKSSCETNVLLNKLFY